MNKQVYTEENGIRKCTITYDVMSTIIEGSYKIKDDLFKIVAAWTDEKRIPEKPFRIILNCYFNNEDNCKEYYKSEEALLEALRYYKERYEGKFTKNVTKIKRVIVETYETISEETI